MSSQKGGQPNQTNNNSHNSSRRKGGHSKKAGWRSSRLPTAKRDDFKGECEDLKGKTYIVGSAKQADNYNNTTEAIMEYFLREYTYGLDVVVSLENFEEKNFTPSMPMITIPEGISAGTKGNNFQTTFSHHLQGQPRHPNTLQTSTNTEEQEDFVRIGIQEATDALSTAKERHILSV